MEASPPVIHSPFTLTGRVIVITGGAQGIGRALAECALGMGARVALIDIDAGTLERTAAELKQPEVRVYPGDVTREDFVDGAVARIAADFGDIHGLVNNAGIVRAALTHRMSLDQWQQVIDVNLTGAFLCLRAVGRHLIDKAERGEPSPGRIVNVSSDAGRRGTTGQINYGAAKSGMLGLTMSAAREWGRYNINVNSVCFGLVETTMTETLRSDRFRERYRAQIPLGRFSTPTEIAPATCFLLTDAAAYITGQHLGVDGGFHISA